MTNHFSTYQIGLIQNNIRDDHHKKMINDAFEASKFNMYNLHNVNEYVAGYHGGQRGSWAPLHQLQPRLVCTRRPLRGLHISILRGQEAFCSDFSRV